MVSQSDLALFMVSKFLASSAGQAKVKAVREKLVAGYLPAMSCNLQFSCAGGTVEEDRTVTDSTSLEWSSVLALAMHRAGFAKDALRQLASDCLTGNLTEAEKAVVAQGDKRWDAEVKPLLPKRTNAGSVKVQGAKLTVVG